MTESLIMEKGMRTLIDVLGIVNAERFITILIREPFDYTKWQREYFDNMTVDEINEAAVSHSQNNARAQDA